MTEFEGSVVAEFSASHELPGHPRCGRRHGHRWRIVVSIKAGEVPATGELHRLPELATAVEQFAAELHREDVGDMLPGSPATAAGVALALQERLILHWHNITKIEVWADNVGSILHV